MSENVVYDSDEDSELDYCFWHEKTEDFSSDDVVYDSDVSKGTDPDSEIEVDEWLDLDPEADEQLDLDWSEKIKSHKERICKESQKRQSSKYRKFRSRLTNGMKPGKVYGKQNREPSNPGRSYFAPERSLN